MVLILIDSYDVFKKLNNVGVKQMLVLKMIG